MSQECRQTANSDHRDGRSDKLTSYRERMGTDNTIARLPGCHGRRRRDADGVGVSIGW